MENNVNELYAPTPPKDIFYHKTTALKQALMEQKDVFFLDRIEYPETGGIFVYTFGADIIEKNGNKMLTNRVNCKYPTKGFPTPEAIQAINIPKRYFINQLKFLKELKTPLLFLALLPFRYKIRMFNKWLRVFNSFNNPILIPHILEERYLADSSKELKKFIKEFLLNLGIDFDTSLNFAINFASLIDYDTAYRYRFQDIASEIDKENITKNPAQELQRLYDIFCKREPNMKLPEHFKMIVKPLSLILYIPRIKKAFIKAFKAIDIDKLGQDEADRFNCLNQKGYDFGGRSFEDRYKEYLEAYNNNPPHYVQFEAL